MAAKVLRWARLRQVGGRFPSWIQSLVQSLRNRLIFLTTLAVGLGALVSSIVVYQVAQRSLYDRMDDELLTMATRQAPIVAAQIASNALLTTEGLAIENVVLLIVQANRDVTLASSQVNPLEFDDPEIAVARLGFGTRQRTSQRADGTPYRIVAVPLPATAGVDSHYVLILGRDLTATNRTLGSLQLMQWIAGLIGLTVGIGTGLALARTSLRSIRHLSQGVDQITQTNRLEPVEVTGSDEVAHLGRSFNSLVSSLALSRERQGRLIADASHELRTPLTSLRTNVELLIADENSGMLPEGARSDILRDIAEQLSEFTILIGDLVDLSRETGLRSTDRTILDFQSVVQRAAARAHRRGPNLIFDVVVEPTLVEGDATALERAVTNLLDNAVKFSPPGGRVTVRLANHRLSVRDQGPGITDEDLPHIFERFYRSDHSRNTPGTGLGLSIVDHTVLNHGGTVRVERPADGGAEFVVWLPPATDSEDEAEPAAGSTPLG